MNTTSLYLGKQKLEKRSEAFFNEISYQITTIKDEDHRRKLKKQLTKERVERYTEIKPIEKVYIQKGDPYFPNNIKADLIVNSQK